MKSKFEAWFQQQPFYLNLRFIHGERLFIFDAQDGYVVQAVQISWVSWIDHQKQVDILTDWLKEADASQEKMQSIIDELESKLKAVDALSRMRAAVIGSFNTQNLNARTKRKMLILKRAEQALKVSEPKMQEPQVCDHTMVEKTQFGDLERTFECIFCDHKTTEAWVTTHE